MRTRQYAKRQKKWFNTNSFDETFSLDDISSNDIVKYGRWSTFFLMIIAAIWAPMIQYFGGIWVYLQQMYAIFVPPIVVLFLIGVFDKKGNANGAYLTLILGLSLIHI